MGVDEDWAAGSNGWCPSIAQTFIVLNNSIIGTIITHSSPSCINHEPENYCTAQQQHLTQQQEPGELFGDHTINTPKNPHLN